MLQGYHGELKAVNPEQVCVNPADPFERGSLDSEGEAVLDSSP